MTQLEEYLQRRALLQERMKDFRAVGFDKERAPAERRPYAYILISQTPL